MSPFEAAKVSGIKMIEDLASAIELTYHSMELGYPEADAKEWMNTVALKCLIKVQDICPQLIRIMHINVLNFKS